MKNWLGNRAFAAMILILFMIGNVFPFPLVLGQTSASGTGTTSANSGSENGEIYLVANLAGSTFTGNVNGTFTGSIAGTLTGKVNGTLNQGESSYSVSFSYRGTFNAPSKVYDVSGKGTAQGTGGSISSGSFNGTLTNLVSQLACGEISGALSGSEGSFSVSNTYLSSGQSSSLSLRANFTGTFAQLYAVTFNEVGLASGTQWAVTVSPSASGTVTSGTSAPSGVTLYSTSSSIILALPNGQYDFSVVPVDGYSSSPSSGAFTVQNANLSEPIKFSPVSTPTQYYTVTFEESGLPSGSSWSVTFNGITRSSSGSSVAFSSTPPGTYPFSITAPSGYSASPSTGSVKVSTTSVTEPISFSQQTYSVTFTESGLPSGSSWSVSLNGITQYSTTDEVVFSEVVGTYSYSISPPPGYYASPSSGSITVEGPGVSQAIEFASTTFSVSLLPNPNGLYVTQGKSASGELLVNLTSGLPKSVQLKYYTSKGLSVTINPSSGEPPFSSEITVSAASSLATGTYPLQIWGSVNGATVGSASISIDVVSGPTYALTFDESGLPSNGAWTVTLYPASASPEGTAPASGLVQHEVSHSDQAIFYVPAGAYSYSVSSSGYAAFPSSGKLLISAASSVPVKFVRDSSLVEVTLTAPAGGSVVYSLEGYPGEEGTVPFGSSIVLSAPVNSALTVTAQPSQGYSFRYWLTKGSVSAVANQSTTHLRVNGTGSASPEFGPVLYQVNFFQDDLLPYSQWAVNLNGTTVYSTGRNATFFVPAGTYSYSVEAPSGRYASPSSGTLQVTGPLSLDVDFPLSHAVKASSYARAFFASNPERFSSQSGQYYTGFRAQYFGYNESSFATHNPSTEQNVPSIPPYVYNPELYLYASMLNKQSLLPSVPTGIAPAYVTDNLNNGTIGIAISATGIASASAQDWLTAEVQAPENPNAAAGSYSDEMTYNITITTVVFEDATAGIFSNVGLTSIQAMYMPPTLGTVMHTMSLDTSATIGNPFSPENNPVDDEETAQEAAEAVQFLWESYKLIPELEKNFWQLDADVSTNLTQAINKGKSTLGASANSPPNLESYLRWGLTNPFIQIYTDSYANTIVTQPGHAFPISAGVKIIAGNAGLGTTDIYAVTFVQINVYPGDVLQPPPPSGPYLSGFSLYPSNKIYVNQYPTAKLSFNNLWINGLNRLSNGSSFYTINGSFNEVVNYPYAFEEFGRSTTNQPQAFIVQGPSSAQSASVYVRFSNTTSATTSVVLNPNTTVGSGAFLMPGNYMVSAEFGTAGGDSPWTRSAYPNPPNMSRSINVTVMPLPTETSLLIKGQHGGIWTGKPVNLTAVVTEDYSVDGGPPLDVLPGGTVYFYATPQSSSSPSSIEGGQLIANISLNDYNFINYTAFRAQATWTPQHAGNYTIRAIYSGLPIYPFGNSNKPVALLLTGSTQTVYDVDVRQLGPGLTLSSSPAMIGNYSGMWVQNATLKAQMLNGTYSGSSPLLGQEVYFRINASRKLLTSYDGFTVCPSANYTNSAGIATCTLSVISPPSNPTKLTLVAESTPYLKNGTKYSTLPPVISDVTVYYYPSQVTGPSLELSASPNPFGRLTIDPKGWVNDSTISAFLTDNVEAPNGQGTVAEYVQNETLQFWIVTPNGLSTSYDGFTLSNYGFVTTNQYGAAYVKIASSSSDTSNVTLTVVVQSVPPSFGGGAGGSHHAERSAASTTSYVPVNGTMTVTYYVKTVSGPHHHVGCKSCSVQVPISGRAREYLVTLEFVSSEKGGYGMTYVGHHIYMR
ncbi:MAG: hypothetical protein RXR41_01200 [Candidatus Marsarchaeota archaeon]